MKMTGLEKFFIRTSLRVFFLRKYEAPRVLGGLNIPQGSICLEIGCGQGAGTLLINRYLDCSRIIGVDIDPDMVESAKKYIAKRPRWARNVKNDNIEFEWQDGAALSFSDNQFDAAFLFGVLDHIKDWPAVIKEVYRVLKKGGIFSFEEFLLDTRAENRLGHVSIGEQELIGALTGAGFEIQSFEVRKRWQQRCFVRVIKSN